MARNALARRKNQIMRAPDGWEPQPPKVKFSERGKYLYTRLSLNVAPGVVFYFTSRVDLEIIEQQLRDGYRDDVSGIFGSIFKGIKKAVKTVGKATGLNKVVKIAGKVLNNPIVKAIVPGAAAAAAGVKIATDVAKATGLAGGKKKGRKAAPAQVRYAAPRRAPRRLPPRRQKAANYYLTRAAVTAQRAGLTPQSRQAAAQTGAKIYKLIVNPQ